MKLDHTLPAAEAELVHPLLGGQDPLYVVRTDLAPDGRYADGFTVIGENRLVVVRDGVVEKTHEIAEGQDYTSVAMVGNGRLECKQPDGDVVLARFSKTLVPEYGTMARALNQLSAGRTPRFVTIEEHTSCPVCGRAFEAGSRTCPHCTSKSKLLLRLLRYARPFRTIIIFAFVLYCCITGIQLGIPRISRAIVDQVIVPGRQDFGMLAGLVALNAAAVAGMIGLTIVRGRTLAKLGNGVERDLRHMVFTKIQALSLGYVNQQKTGNLMNRITGDTQRIQGFIAGFTSELLNSMFFIIAAMLLMVGRDWRLAVFVAAPVPVVFFLLKLAFARLRRLEHRLWHLVDRAQHLLQDILSGIRVVKAFGREAWEVDRFKSASDRVRELTERAGKAWNSLIPFFGFVFGFGQYLVLLYGGRLVLRETMELGELIQYSMYAGMIYGPLAWLTHLPRAFTRMITAAARIFDVIDEEPDVVEKRQAVRHRINGRIVFENVTFGYHTHEPVLDGINLEVEPGEMIGLVGHSGAGKSTLTNLILRLYDVDEGRILIDGVDIRDVALKDLRSQMGVVLQETFLFSGTILENIIYAKPDAAPEEVIRAAKIAHAHDFIIRFPNGYDTKVGERGQRLSGGEAQRVAIARAVIHNPRVLILDEATSSVDTDTEQKIQDALDHLVKDRTTIAIAHRLATLRNADRLVVLEKGRIAEVGTHDELIRKRGIYHRLITTQRKMAGAIGVNR